MKDNSVPEWKSRLHEIIFEADTPAGKLFDVVLIVSIIASVLTVIVESVSTFRNAYGYYLNLAEWFFTILFTIEYLLRLSCVGRPLRYATSFFGIVESPGHSHLPQYFHPGQPVAHRDQDPAPAAYLPGVQAERRYR